MTQQKPQAIDFQFNGERLFLHFSPKDNCFLSIIQITAYDQPDLNLNRPKAVRALKEEDIAQKLKLN